MKFKDRTEAGHRLAERLAGLRPVDPVVLALPRGGVPVGYEVAVALAAPLDVILVRKIGAPWHRELAVGAIADGDPPEIVVNTEIESELGIPDSYIEEESRTQMQEIERRRQLYRAGRAPLPLSDRTAIVVDDGIATGATMRAALRAVRRGKPRAIILAVPVAPPDSVDTLRAEADQVICLSTPEYFAGVGQFYTHFDQVDDATVTDLLRKRADALASSGAPRDGSGGR